MCSTCGCKGAESFCSECGTKRAESFEAEVTSMPKIVEWNDNDGNVTFTTHETFEDDGDKYTLVNDYEASRKRSDELMDAESFEAPKGQLFTPYKNTTSDETINMRINATDMRNFDKLPNKSRRTVLITNMKDGKRYYVRRADCGAGCYCAAEVVKVKEAESFEAEYDERSPALRNFGTIALLALAVFVGKKLKE